MTAEAIGLEAMWKDVVEGRSGKFIDEDIQAGERLDSHGHTLVIEADVRDGAEIWHTGRGNVVIKGNIGQDVTIYCEEGSVQVQDVGNGTRIDAKKDVRFQDSAGEVFIRSREGAIHGRKSHAGNKLEAKHDVVMDRIGPHNEVVSHKGSIRANDAWKGSTLKAKHDITGHHSEDTIEVSDDVTLITRRGEVKLNEKEKGKNVTVKKESGCWLKDLFASREMAEAVGRQL